MPSFHKDANFFFYMLLKIGLVREAVKTFMGSSHVLRLRVQLPKRTFLTGEDFRYVDYIQTAFHF